MNEINVMKWGGRTEPYNREKIRITVEKYRLNDVVVNQVLDEVEENLYDGITTKEIYSLIEEKIGARPRILKRDLRSALGEMSSKPDFEVFVQQLRARALVEHGLLNYVETTGKGGYRRLYSAKFTKLETSTFLSERVNERLLTL